MVGRPRGDFALRTSRVETYQTTRRPQSMCSAGVPAHEPDFGLEFLVGQEPGEIGIRLDDRDVLRHQGGEILLDRARRHVGKELGAADARLREPRRRQGRRFLRRHRAESQCERRNDDRRQPSKEAATPLPANGFLRSARTSPVQILTQKYRPHRRACLAEPPVSGLGRSARIRASLRLRPIPARFETGDLSKSASRTKTCAPPHILTLPKLYPRLPHFTC